MLEINIQKIKFWLIIGLIQIGSFSLGYYSAGNLQQKPTQVLPNNYNTKANPEPKEIEPKDTVTDNCPIKGNISSKSKIYHVEGGAFYDRTTAEMCFNSEPEAQAAGFTKSSR